jgi:hypothetical protein
LAGGLRYFSHIASTRAAPSCSGRLLLILLKLLARWLIIHGTWLQRLLVSLAARVVLMGVLLWGGSLGRWRLREVRVWLLCYGGCLRLAIIYLILLLVLTAPLLRGIWMRLLYRFSNHNLTQLCRRLVANLLKSRYLAWDVVPTSNWVIT